ncbi:MAG: hypothetical protein A3F74_25705 [Betaproteobacteria bacterium RIFCSPLOWO2_12_FULL_62_58]|nr:MAG: hypothetical protein A3F74_25705 [Betaproteobacteria bacterium RIFCSPLOWO2_12_FULL_62_58]
MASLARVAYGFVLALLVSGNANAWFIVIPTGAIARALETDPDTIVVSSADRALGKCAGLHVNQGQKFSTSQSPFPDDVTTRPESPEAIFHGNMANMAVEKASEKDKVKDLANAYSARWGRVAGADLNANRAYGADLARGCMQNDIPLRTSDYTAWQAKQEETKRRAMEEERIRAEETQKRLRAEEEARQARAAIKASPPPEPIQVSSPPKNIDYTAEARKSARILGCATEDVRVIGIEVQNILFSAKCETGQSLVLTCDQSGLCLRK